ncbi:MAG: hypothetical protein DMG65_11475 [Candidatus Angelobacter sp. Gp1-AA117]|nr:MAG: hypothetical protein DMG65_11475 [Candidatus Angelobacter sp. Gp1-AA117]
MVLNRLQKSLAARWLIMAEYLHMRRLNTKERQRMINSRLLMAFYCAILFYNERHHGTFFFIYFLA